MVGLPAVAHNQHCRMRLENRLKETEEGQKRLADVERRMEEGKAKKSRVALEQTGLPDPQDGEVRSRVALGQPEEEGQDSPKRGQAGERKEASKKARSAPSQREKRRPETELDDLYHDLLVESQ